MQEGQPRDDHRAPAGGARCVVLHPADSPPRSTLLSALARHGLDVTTHASPHQALAALCLAGKDSPRVLLFTEPARLPAADRLARAVERFCPGCACWEYRPGANPPVRGYVVTGVTAAAPQPAADPARLAIATRASPPPPRRAGSPMLRLIEAPDGPPIGEEAEPSPSRLLTGEELSMLLAEGKDGRP